MFSRRAVIIGFGAAAASGCALARTPDVSLTGLEQAQESEFGVFAREVGGAELLSNRADQRFAMCSTFKWLLGALILQDAEAGNLQLDRRLVISSDDLVFHSPVTRQHIGGEGLTVQHLCATTIQTSDNTAANLLLNQIGGPEGFTRRLRALGDTVTRLDRLEPILNENAPGDPRDTTTPRAMAAHMDAFLFGSVLSSSSRDLLRSWMIEADTGLDRLRAGFPQGWTSGDKTGTSSNRANNDVAFANPPTEH